MGTIEKILALAAQAGIKQGALERAVGLPQNRISKWKDGTGEPTLRQAAAVAEFLRVPLIYLADDTMMEPPSEPELTSEELTALDFFRKILAQVVRPSDALGLMAELNAALGLVPPGHKVNGVSLTIQKEEVKQMGGKPALEPVRSSRGIAESQVRRQKKS